MNAQTRIEPEGSLTRAARKQAAIAEVRARFYAQWQKISADMQAEIRSIEKEFWQ